MRATVTGSFCFFFLIASIKRSACARVVQIRTSQIRPSPILSGTVSSDRDGPMEGVLVSAKKAGSTITTTVVSDSKGHYGFPADRLAPGAYKLAIRAAGYALDGSDAITLSPGAPATADLKLKPAPITPDQVTNAEWLTSAPGPDAQTRDAELHGLSFAAADFRVEPQQ